MYEYAEFNPGSSIRFRRKSLSVQQALEFAAANGLEFIQTEAEIGI